MQIQPMKSHKTKAQSYQANSKCARQVSKASKKAKVGKSVCGKRMLYIRLQESFMIESFWVDGNK